MSRNFNCSLYNLLMAGMDTVESAQSHCCNWFNRLSDCKFGYYLHNGCTFILWIGRRENFSPPNLLLTICRPNRQ